MEVVGTLKVKFETQKVSERFTKRDFVLTTEASTPYPQHVSFQITQDKCSLLDQFNEGEEIKVQFNLRGREWKSPQGETKFFNTLEAWRIERLQGSNNGGQTAQNTNQASNNTINTNTSPVFTANTDDNDDLPF
jgi:hypothetical protein